jgi:hypothetical protein
VPDKIFGLALILDFIDRGHSLRSLHPPPAALPSLPIKGYFLIVQENIYYNRKTTLHRR